MLKVDLLDEFIDEFLDGFDHSVSLDFLDQDIDQAVYPIIQVGVANRRPIFQRLGQDIENNQRLLRRYVLGRVGNARGVWVEGGRSDAVDLARRLGLHRITEGERHASGRRHIHGYAGEASAASTYFMGELFRG